MSPPLAPSRRLARSLPLLYGVGALRLLVPLLVLPLVAWRVGADEFGRLSFILVWAGLLSTLVEGGFLAAATRLAVNASASRRWQLAQQVFSARCVLCLPVLALAWVAARYFAPGLAGSSGAALGLAALPALAEAPHTAADAFAIAALACALGWPATWYLQGTQQLHRWARVEAVVYAALLLACWAFARSVGAYVLLQFVAAAVLALLGWRWLYRDLAMQADTAGGAGANASASASPNTDAHADPAAGSAAAAAKSVSRRLWSPRQLRAGLRLGATMLPVSVAGAAYSFALPAAAAGHLPKAELGLYFMADRIVRALLAAADPIYQLVYPRIVALFAADAAGAGSGAGSGRHAALRSAARWAAGGALAGMLVLALGHVLWPLAKPLLASLVASRGAGTGGGIGGAAGARAALDPAHLGAVLAVLGWLLPLLSGWKFFGYWMLGSGRFDGAYRASMLAGAVVGIGGAWWVGLAGEAAAAGAVAASGEHFGHGAIGLAWLALAVEAVVIAVAVAGVWLTRRHRAAPANRAV